MSAAESEESRWPDLATASMRTQSERSTVAQRSSSGDRRLAAPCAPEASGRGPASGGVTCARLASAESLAVKRMRAGGRASTPRSPENAGSMNRVAADRALVGAALAAVVRAAAGDDEPEIAAAPTTTGRAARDEHDEPGRRRRPRRAAPTRLPGRARGAGRDGDRGPAGERARARRGAHRARLRRRARRARRRARLRPARARARWPSCRAARAARRAARASLDASIGYRDPRGLPVWEGAEVARVRVIELAPAGTQAKVVATVVTGSPTATRPRSRTTSSTSSATAGAGSSPSRARPSTVRSGSPTSPRRCSARR